MAQLTETDKAAFRELTQRGWKPASEEQSPRLVEQTVAGRERYMRWASEASLFFKGRKAVDFEGEHWKL